MIETMRWFGPSDHVTLSNIRQAGASGVVTAMHDIALETPWPLSQVLSRKSEIEASGLRWDVVESIPVAEEIKATGVSAGKDVETWIKSLHAVAEAGLKTVCYNFSIGVDWVRTDTEFTLANGAQALHFDATAFAAFDLFILKRQGAEAEYTAKRIELAERYFSKASEEELKRLTQAITAGLPGAMIGALDIGAFREKIARYSAITNDEIRANLLEFQSVVVPEAERLGVDLCIHPNDPPNSLFGLPLAASTPEDFNKMFAANPSPANGLTWCLGSLSVGDPAEALSIGRNHADRIRFAHLRVVSKDHDDPESFHEAEHLSGEVDLIEAVDILLREEDRRSASGATAPIPMRPDHGHRIADDLQRAVNPGYSFYGRLKGLAELRGAAAALRYVRART